MCRAWGSSLGRVAAGSVFQGAVDGLDGRERQFGAGAPAIREVDDDEIGLGIDQQPRAGRAAVLERASRAGAGGPNPLSRMPSGPKSPRKRNSGLSAPAMRAMASPSTANESEEYSYR